MRKRAVLYGPEICPFQDSDPVIVSQLPGQLSVTYVNSEDFVSAGLQEAVGKSAGGRSNIETPGSGRIDPEMLEGKFKF